MAERLRLVDRDKATRLYAAGASLRDVGAAFGVDGVTIRNRFVEWGIPRRGSGDRKKGVPHSPIHRARIGASHRGRRSSLTARRNLSQARLALHIVPWNKGKRKATHPEIRYGAAASAHWAWKGGISAINNRIRQSSEYKVWRDAVFRRDDFTCQACRRRGGYLEADHIKRFADYPELRFDVANGRTLCRACHKMHTCGQSVVGQ